MFTDNKRDAWQGVSNRLHQILVAGGGTSFISGHLLRRPDGADRGHGGAVPVPQPALVRARHGAGQGRRQVRLRAASPGFFAFKARSASEVLFILAGASGFAVPAVRVAITEGARYDEGKEGERNEQGKDDRGFLAQEREGDADDPDDGVSGSGSW